MIETARLRLRPWREEDRSAFVAVINTPAMLAELGGPKSRAEIDASFDRRVADQARDGFCYWAVETRGDGALVGTCGVLLGLNYAGTPVEGLHELGWRIAETHWRNGFAREAAEATLRWVWTNTAAPLVAAWTTIGNVPSWGLMERLGMMRRPELDFARADQPHVPLIVYTLARPS